jgi:MoxR-like ATPase
MTSTTFTQQVVPELLKLKGKVIDSPKPSGRKLKLLDVSADGSVTAEQTSDEVRSHIPRSQLEDLWLALLRDPSIHVESELGGGGSRRHQPETVLANLPVVEYLKKDNKTHIAYVGKPTHAAGTVKAMSAQDAAKVKAGTPIRTYSFAFEDLRQRATGPPYNLRLPDAVYLNLISALASGKNVILTGPPGTAKTTLAQCVCEVAVAAGLSAGLMLTTATSDWTTYETIGGLRPTASSELQFEEGIFLRAIRADQWLIVDELNRANFDRAFGQLFTVLSGQPVELPYRRPGQSEHLTVSREPVPESVTGDILPVPAGWRMVATMNNFDKTLLYDLSFALMRRFAFVEVPAPTHDEFVALVAEKGGSAEGAAGATLLYDMVVGTTESETPLKRLGPALFIDAAQFLTTRGEAETPSGNSDAALLAAFYAFLLPQFEDADPATARELYRRLAARLTSHEASLALRNQLEEVLVTSLETRHAGTTSPTDAEEAEAAEVTQ